jgi:hypothetical protein
MLISFNKYHAIETFFFEGTAIETLLKFAICYHITIRNEQDAGRPSYQNPNGPWVLVLFLLGVSCPTRQQATMPCGLAVDT